MKKIFTLCLLLSATLNFAQNWQSIGTSFGTSVSTQDMFIDETSGNIYVIYNNTVNDRVTVKKWNGTTWATLGNADFGSGVNILDAQITVIDDIPYVALKYTQTGTSHRIRAYELISGTWTAMGTAAYPTNLTTDFSFKASPNDGLYLTFFNNYAPIGITGEIVTISIVSSSEGLVGGYIDSQHGNELDLVIDENELVWVSYVHEDISDDVVLMSQNYPNWDNQGGMLSEYTEKIVTNLPNDIEDYRFGALVEDSGDDYLVSRRYDLSTLSGSSVQTIATFTGDNYADFAMASDSQSDFFFYTNTANDNFVEKIDASGVQTLLGSNFAAGTGAIGPVDIHTWNDRVVVSFVRNSAVYVMEYNNPCELTLGNSFGGCEQTLITAPTVTVTVDDNNYVHPGFTITAAGTDVSLLSETMIGTFPNYYLQFNSSDIPANMEAEFEIETMENGINTNYQLFYAYIDAMPNVLLSLPPSLDEVCENEGIFNLNPYGSPAGGFWSGPGVNPATGKFNPDIANPGLHTINYSVTTPYGCINDDNTTIAVNSVPAITVATVATTCGTEDGIANATITGGTPAYTIYWSNGSSSEDQDSLAAGIYYINVTDTKGCHATKPANVTTTGLTLAGVSTNTTCPGASTGAIDLTANSTSGVASYAWSTGASTQDVSGLVAGTYEVTVTANDGCVSTASFEVTSPAPLTFSASTVSATCASTDGSATCNVTGGTAPYDFLWFEAISGSPIGTNSPTLSGVGGGGYFAIITDDNGCSAIHNTMVTEVGGPDVLIAAVTPAGCTDDGAIDISIVTDQPVTSFEWSNGQTTEDISNLTAGFYTVEVIDADGCTGMGGVEVPAAAPDLIPICLVTVDTATNTNLLVWEKPTTTDIDYFNIYRETSVAGEFLFIASVPYSDESVFNDLVASPQVRSWRYKIGAVNFCGEESDLSEFHKTIHLTISIGLGALINLNWDAYEGMPFPTYDLYRHTNLSGWVLLQSMPSNLFSYADTPPTINGLDYIIAVSPPDTCTSTLLKVQDHNSSRSNKSSSITGPLLGIEETDASVSTLIYPNPSTGTFNIYVTTENATGFEAIITDAQGRVIMQFSSMQEMAVVDLSAFSDGVYNLQLLANDTVINRKLIKQ